jgi:hypothetical protein
MKKYIIVIIIGSMLLSCTQEDSPKLVGTWVESGYSVNGMQKSLIFKIDGSVDYQDVPNPDNDILPGWSGIFASLQYFVRDKNLYFAGESINAHTNDTIPFEYSTSFSIINNTLYLDSFSYDGGINTHFYKSLKLKKK